jgi:hypothetical protein
MCDVRDSYRDGRTRHDRVKHQVETFNDHLSYLIEAYLQWDSELTALSGPELEDWSHEGSSGPSLDPVLKIKAVDVFHEY